MHQLSGHAETITLVPAGQSVPLYWPNPPLVQVKHTHSNGLKISTAAMLAPAVCCQGGAPQVALSPLRHRSHSLLLFLPPGYVGSL
jgi:hypothetical protein